MSDKIIEKLVTDRLIIRKFREKDQYRFLEFMLDNDSTRHLMFTEEQKTKEGAINLLTFIIESYNSHSPIHSYAIEHPGYGYIGSCGFSKLESSIIECYYSINKEYRNKGYASEAIRSIIKYCFQVLEYDEIRAYMSPGNPNSEKVAQSVGMINQGIQTHPIFKNKGLMYSIKNIRSHENDS